MFIVSNQGEICPLPSHRGGLLEEKGNRLVVLGEGNILVSPVPCFLDKWQWILEENMKQGPGSTSLDLSPAPSSFYSTCPKLEMSSHLMSLCSAQHCIKEWGKITWFSSNLPAGRWEKAGAEAASPLNHTAYRKLNFCWPACFDILQGLWVSWAAMDSWNGKANIFLPTFEDTCGEGWVQKHMRKCVRAWLLPHTWGKSLPQISAAQPCIHRFCALQKPQSFSSLKNGIKCVFELCACF